jgi:hypothetical protein
MFGGVQFVEKTEFNVSFIDVPEVMELRAHHYEVNSLKLRWCLWLFSLSDSFTFSIRQASIPIGLGFYTYNGSHKKMGGEIRNYYRLSMTYWASAIRMFAA